MASFEHQFGFGQRTEKSMNQEIVIGTLKTRKIGLYGLGGREPV